MMQLMNVSIIETESIGSDNGVEFQQLDGSQRAWYFPCYLHAGTPDEAWEYLTKRDIDFQQYAVVEVDLELDSEECQISTGEVNVISLRNNQVILDVSADAEGIVMLSDTNYPGWKARVNGNSSDIFIVDYLFRVVRVPEGKSTVVFSYQPFSFYAGLLISLVTITGLGIWKLREGGGKFFRDRGISGG